MIIRKMKTRKKWPDFFFGVNINFKGFIYLLLSIWVFDPNDLVFHTFLMSLFFQFLIFWPPLSFTDSVEFGKIGMFFSPNNSFIYKKKFEDAVSYTWDQTSSFWSIIMGTSLRAKYINYGKFLIYMAKNAADQKVSVFEAL